MSEVLTKYNLKFTHDEASGLIEVSSSQPLLLCCIQVHNTPHKAAVFHNQVKNFLEFDKSDELVLPIAGSKTLIIKKLNTAILDEDACDHSSKNAFSLPSIDLQDILYNWLLHLQKCKTREIEITNGESIIDIINDGFINALVIEKAVAAHWPDCAGSIGEYYSVSVNDYEKQKELTANLNQSLVSGSDGQVLMEIEKFLNLFTNGKYTVAISEINLNTSEIARDGMITYHNDTKEEDKFTYWTYPSNEQMYLFTRSVNTIDKDRVDYYVNLISNGTMPKIVVYSNYDNSQYDETAGYIIDGHHKLLAYEELRINIPAIFIRKNVFTEQPRKNITPQLVNFLKPVEIMHVIEENDNTADIEAYMVPEITYYIDRILKENKGVDTNIITILYNAYHSDDEKRNNWANERFVVLSKNKYHGKGLRLYYKTIDPVHNYTVFKSVFIENVQDFDIWKKVFLEDGIMPDDVSERQKEISERYYPPYRSPENTYSSSGSYEPPGRFYTETGMSPWRFFALIVVIIVALLRMCG